MLDGQKIIVFIQKNRVKLFIILGLIIMALILSQFGVVIIKTTSSNEDNKIFVNSILSESKSPKSYNIKKSKIAIIKKGDYSFELYSENNISTTFAKISGFSVNTINIEPKEQKISEYIAETPFDCSYTYENNRIIFTYPCSTNYQKTGIEMINIDTGVKTTLLDYEDSNITSATSEIFIKPTKSGLVLIYKNEDTLITQLLNHDGTFSKPTEHTNIHINNVGDSLIYSTNEDNNIGILTQNKIYMIDINNEDYKEYELKDMEIGDLNNQKLIILNNYAYIFSNVSPLDYVTREHIGQTHKETIENNQRITRVDLSTKKIKNIKIPKDFYINNISSSKSYILLTPLDIHIKPLTLNDDVESLLIDTSNILNPCVFNNDIYYISSDRNQLYQYNITNKTSHLIYKTKRYSLQNINCNNVTTINSYDNINDDNSLYKVLMITNSNLGNQTQLSEFLPLSHTFNADTYELTQLGDKIKVEMVYDSNSNGRSSDEELIKEFNSILSENGVNTDLLHYTFQ